MRFGYIVASLAVHAAIIGMMVWCPSAPVPSLECIPIFVEIVEAIEAREETAATLEALPEKVPEVPETTTREHAEIPEGDIEDESIVPQAADTVAEEPKEEAPSIPEDTPMTEDPAPQPVMDAPPIEEAHAKVVSDPVALNRITPRYPRAARRKGHEGSVTVEIRVSEDGGVSDAKIVATSGHAELDRAALAAVGTARFAPATEDGAAVSGLLRLTFEFKLE